MASLNRTELSIEDLINIAKGQKKDSEILLCFFVVQKTERCTANFLIIE